MKRWDTFDGETVEEMKARHEREWVLSEKKAKRSVADIVKELFVLGLLYIVLHFLIKFW
jgi:hypothetical protein